MKEMTEEQIEARKKIIKTEIKAHELVIQQAEHKILRADLSIKNLKKELIDLDFNTLEPKMTIEPPKRRKRTIIEQKEIREVLEDRVLFYDGAEKLRPKLGEEDDCKLHEAPNEELEPSPSFSEEETII